MQARLTVFASESAFVRTSTLVVFSWLDRTVNEADEVSTSGKVFGVALSTDLLTGADATGRDNTEEGTFEPGARLFEFPTSFDFSLHSFMA